MRFNSAAQYQSATTVKSDDQTVPVASGWVDVHTQSFTTTIG